MTDPLTLPLGDNAAYALPLAEGGALLVNAGPDIPAREGETGSDDSIGGTGEAVALLAANGLAPGDAWAAPMQGSPGWRARPRSARAIQRRRRRRFRRSSSVSTNASRARQSLTNGAGKPA